jgi:hypothetical protein
MRRIFLPALVIALLIATVTTTSEVKVGAFGKPPSDVPVTVTIDGNGVNTEPTLRVQSDLLGAYANSTSGQSIIQAIGDWELDMLNFNSSPQRKLLIDLRDAIAGSAPGGANPTNPFGATGYQIVRARFIAKCSQNGINFLNMQTATPYLCPLAVAFQDSTGQQHRLAENPTNFSETNWIQVTCLATDTSAKCKQWKLQPSVIQADGQRKDVAKLLRIPSKPNQPEVDLGDFYLSFSINLTRP